MRSRVRSLAAGFVAAALFAAVPASAQTTLRVVPHSDLKIIDPIWTTAFISRNHGYLIYDTLFAADANFQVKPQMVDTWKVSDDQLTYTFTLRDGLLFHDGAAVTSTDVIASLKRWGGRDATGQAVMAATAELKAVDDKTFQIILKSPFGALLDCLAKSSSSTPFIMPAKVAETPPDKQITDTTGSGPFMFSREDWRPGEKVAYVKNPKYKPRAEPAFGLAGGKVAKVDRVEWVVITDPQTAVNALSAGEVDIIESPLPDLLPLLKDDRKVELFFWNKVGSQALFRFNWLQPPFDNVKIRQAALHALEQEEFLRAQYGSPEVYKVCNAPLICDTPYAKSYGDFMIKPNVAKAKELLKEGGYDGKPILVLHQTDLQSSNQFQPVLKQQLERVGFKVELMAMDWQSVVSRRVKKEAPDKGGWNIFFTTTDAASAMNPVFSSMVGFNGDKAWPGWPSDEAGETFRNAFFTEGNAAKRTELAHKLQDRLVETAAWGWIGQFRIPGAYRKDRVSGWLEAPVPVFWNIAKK